MDKQFIHSNLWNCKTNLATISHVSTLLTSELWIWLLIGRQCVMWLCITCRLRLLWRCAMLSGVLYKFLSVHSTVVTCRADFRLVRCVMSLQIGVPLQTICTEKKIKSLNNFDYLFMPTTELYYSWKRNTACLLYNQLTSCGERKCLCHMINFWYKFLWCYF